MLSHLDIGVRYLGKTDAIGKEAVYTAILVVGIPLLPLGSWYGVRSGPMGDHIAGRRIRLHLKSLTLAYLRRLLDILHVFAHFCPRPNLRRNRWTQLFFSLFDDLKLLYVSLFKGLDKAPRLQRQQRLLLERIVNTTVDPDWLPKRDLQQILANLHPTLNALRLPTDPRYWQMYKPAPDLAPFVYTLARYMRPLHPAADWAIIASRAWSQIATEESAAPDPASSPRAAAETPLLLAKNARS